MKNGNLRVHDCIRNLMYEITPLDEREKDENGISKVIKTFENKLSVQCLVKLAVRLQKDDTSKIQNWEANWNYIFSLPKKKD